VSGQHHTLAPLGLGEEASISIGQTASWFPIASLDVVAKKNSLSLLGMEP